MDNVVNIDDFRKQKLPQKAEDEIQSYESIHNLLRDKRFHIFQRLHMFGVLTEHIKSGLKYESGSNQNYTFKMQDGTILDGDILKLVLSTLELIEISGELSRETLKFIEDAASLQPETE